MRMHPDTGRIARSAEATTAGVTSTRLDTHLAECGDCRATLEWIRDARAVLRGEPPLRAPARAWSHIANRLAAGDVVLLPDGTWPAAAPQPASRRLLAAAVILVLVASAASAMLPGSPLRHWIEAIARPRETPPAAPAMPAAGTAAAAAGDATAPVTTMIVAAADGDVVIEIETPDPGLELRVRLTDQVDLEVRATGAAAGATFRSGPGRLTITKPGAGQILLLLPRQANHIAIGVDRTTYLVKARDRLQILAPVVDTAGTEFILRPGS